MLPLVVVCVYHKLGVHNIEMSALSEMSFSEISSRGGFGTTNSISVNSNNNILSTISQNDITNIDNKCCVRGVVPTWLVGLEVNV